jgi:hypothetical protein
MRLKNYLLLEGSVLVLAAPDLAEADPEHLLRIVGKADDLRLLLVVGNPAIYKKGCQILLG